MVVWHDVDGRDILLPEGTSDAIDAGEDLRERTMRLLGSFVLPDRGEP
jgi:hypothetical protein